MTTLVMMYMVFESMSEDKPDLTFIVLLAIADMVMFLWSFGKYKSLKDYADSLRDKKELSEDEKEILELIDQLYL